VDCATNGYFLFVLVLALLFLRAVILLVRR
jgi:hypothetical protein